MPVIPPVVSAQYLSEEDKEATESVKEEQDSVENQLESKQSTENTDSDGIII